jgi:cellulose synthase/poly-beta-1,6-N-acetylglucosamine synthase-like glycosyltransferase
VITLQVLGFLLYAAIVTTLFALLVPGYLLWLWWGRERSPRPGPLPSATDVPPLDVIVPVQNEAALVGAKLDDLAALNYPPARVRFLLVDGASADGTWEALTARAAADARFVALRVGHADKTRQLNAGLERCRADWVVVTDADATLPPDALERLMATAAVEPNAAVLGTSVLPRQSHALERLHWRVANQIRQRESERGSASLVTGPCYAFRRTLLARFPDDVVSDDVHVALAAAACGRRVVVADVRVTEQRSPVRLVHLLRHKLRKTDGYLREIFRFLPEARGMSAPARTIFLWRAAQLTILPVLVTLGVLGAAVAAAQALPPSLHLLLPSAAVVLVGASWWGLRRMTGPVLLVVHGVVLAVVTLAALVAYPFTRQTAAFPKVPSGGPRA